MIQKMKSPGIKKWFKRKSNQEWVENANCKNCETQFSGKFCPECGQSVRDYDKPFSFIFYNFVGDFFAFDIRFFRTFAALLFNPGFLTKEYFAGKRVKYAPPFRIFIFVSFILFLLLQIYTNRGLTTILDSSFSENNILALDSTTLAISDSTLTKAIAEIDTTQNEVINLADLEAFRDTKDLRQSLSVLASTLETKLQEETDPKKKLKLREYIRLCHSPEQAMAKILEYMSWAFFLLLPIFALILKLFYFRRNRNYMHHLIFSIHIHSFIFIIFILNVSLYFIFNGDLSLITSLLLLSVPIYFVVALKKFYGQKTGKVIMKFILISFFYNIIFVFTVGIVFLNALRLPL